MPKFLTSINLTKNELQNAALHNLSSAPASPVLGQVYFNSTNGDKKPYIWNGTTWVDLAQQNTDTITRLKGGTSGTLVSGDINLLAGSNITIGQSGNDITITGASGSLTFTGDVTGTGTTGGTTSLTLSNTGVTAGTYNNVTVDAKGRVTNASNVAYLTSYTETDTLATVMARGASTSIAMTLSNTTDASSSTVGGALTVSGGAAIAKKIFVGGDADFAANVVIDGNLTVAGTTTTISTQNLAVADNMIYLNEGSQETNPDLGFAGNYNNGTYAHAGIFRDASDGVWKFYQGYTPEPGVFIDTAHASFALAPIQASTVTATTFTGNLTGNVTGTVSGNAGTATKLATARTIATSGDATWSVSFDGSANVTSALTLANSGVTAGTYNNSATAITPFTVDAKGRITSTGSAVTITPAWSNITSKPSNLAYRYTTTIGDGSATSFTITHNLGQFANIQVYETASPYSQVYADITADSATACTVSFSTAPTSGQYTVVVVG